MPRAQAEAVLEIARKIDSADTRRKTDIGRGTSVAALVQKQYKS